jgi:cytochrome c-type biogenesis protein CcmH/NrfF
VEILLWLLPAVLVTTVVAILVGLRRGAPERRDDAWTREEAARQMGEALSRRVERF